MMKKVITLKDIAGYATEKAVWQLVLSLSGCCGRGELSGVSAGQVMLSGKEFGLSNGGAADPARAFAAPETFADVVGNASERSVAGKTTAPPEASDVWSVGALAFYAITGVDVFEGKGGATQTADTAVPRIGSAHASQELSTLIRQCLCYSPAGRPSKETLKQKAQEALARQPKPRRRLISQTGKGYASSLIKFWPEEMVPALLICLLMATSLCAKAQHFSKALIPDEMATLVMRCIDLRSPQNVAKVSKAMDRDMSWTMMDELDIDKKGECTTADMVDMFGLNDVGFSVIKRHGGVTNAGGRFRDGRDSRFKYSFIEITVKKGKSVSYTITGREGEQIFAVVPFDKAADFTTSVKTKDGKQHDGAIIDDVCYIHLKQGIKRSDSFVLTLTNKSGKNMAFALINYNSWNHE